MRREGIGYRVIEEARSGEIRCHPQNFNRAQGLKISKTWNPTLKKAARPKHIGGRVKRIMMGIPPSETYKLPTNSKQAFQL
jgi:hypothetical protein